ncbi:phosphonate ABC transporter, permease protein PhnE [Halomonas sp. ML-15]|uniref:phosphonate ABC transporter, permease protein PhnE n=1 Tax=Halomonas sp. ML-15 TaxID=2773305 RepID=UPI0017469DBF|nr:phosphonate ABC transporter, permease protein PhnE [Halomonas sp. ML-15]MBD3896462.1 phosphonate ABC transporter, permease protein PhnE [Halomonas sp. ML-15]
MPVTQTQQGSRWVRHSSRDVLVRYTVLLLTLVAFIVAMRFISGQTMWVFVSDAPRQAADFTARMFPPDIGFFPRAVAALWETINIAVFGTILGVIIALPLAILCAKNTTPHSSIRAVALTLSAASRSVTSLIWALLLVQVVGPGLLAGVLAVGIRSVGMITKILYETIEEIDTSPIEAVKSTGASETQIFLYGYMPQLMSAFVGITVYRWEINIRESTIIGIVGGGGIGFLLNSAINRLAWDQVSVILITILACVFFAEIVSAKIRAAVN